MAPLHGARLGHRALQCTLPRLRELFADGGIVLNDVDISAGDGRRGGSGDRNPQDPGAAPGTGSRAAAEAPAVAAPRLADGLVDTFA